MCLAPTAGAAYSNKIAYETLELTLQTCVLISKSNIRFEHFIVYRYLQQTVITIHPHIWISCDVSLSSECTHDRCEWAYSMRVHLYGPFYIHESTSMNR